MHGTPWPHVHNHLSEDTPELPILVLTEILCPATSTVTVYADAVLISFTLPAYSYNPRPPKDVPTRHRFPWCSTSILRREISYPCIPLILCLSCSSHLLCQILIQCVYPKPHPPCIPLPPADRIFPRSCCAVYEAITITGTAPLADINIELLWLITNITASFGGGVNWR